MGRIPADRNFLLHRARGCRGLNRQFTQLGGGVRGAVFEDGVEEVDGDGHGFDATLDTIDLGDDGIMVLVSLAQPAPAAAPRRAPRRQEQQVSTGGRWVEKRSTSRRAHQVRQRTV
jgi:hypothetical protein